jgi:hypothetical protein
MIVTSVIDFKKYFWVKVPRTATHSYEKIFFPEFTINNIIPIHSHAPYFSLQDARCENKVQVDGGFTVVRNPYDRFVSALKYLKKKRNSDLSKWDDAETILSVCEFCGEQTIITKEQFDSSVDTDYIDFLENETIFYEFVYSYFDKNCILKPGCFWEDMLNTEAISVVPTMFKTQTFFAYHPQVKIFKYENLQEFNNWIESTLGISTSTLSTYNSTNDVELNINVTTNKFKDLVKYLFHDDFKLFDYDI